MFSLVKIVLGKLWSVGTEIFLILVQFANIGPNSKNIGASVAEYTPECPSVIALTEVTRF